VVTSGAVVGVAAGAQAARIRLSRTKTENRMVDFLNIFSPQMVDRNLDVGCVVISLDF
jgi:hypothetical protein